MAARSDRLLRYVRRLALRAGRDADDGALLTRFVTQHDQAAFEALVYRHGPMVLRVCQRLLANGHDAEDAFQATFLVLARKAACIRPANAVAAWLHGVAYRIACGARAAGTRRRFREVPLSALGPSDRHPDPLSELSAREALRLLDEEVQQLPRAYRLPIILCCLEGLSQEDAARRLGWTPGSIKGRLERARKCLRQRLTRRGLELSAGLGLIEVSRGGAAGLAEPLVASTTKAAVSFAASGSGEISAVPAKAIALATGALKQQAIFHVKVGMILLVSLGGAIAGLGTWAHYKAATEQGNDSPVAAVSQAHDAQQPQHSGKAEARKDGYGDPLPEGALARLGTVRFRDITQPTIQLAYGAGGKMLIASGAQFFRICSWDAHSGRPLYQLTATGEAESLAVSPDGKSLFVGDYEGSLWGIEAVTGKTLRKFTYPGRGIRGQAAFSPDNRTVAIAAYDEWRVVRWDFATGRLFPQLGGGEEIGGAVAYAPDGKFLVTAHRDNSIRLWDSATGKEVRRLTGHKKPVQSLAFAPGGKILASSGEGNVIRLWDLDTGKAVHLLQGSGGFNWRVVFSPDGRFLAVLGGDGKLDHNRIDAYTLRIFDASTGKQLFRWESISAVAFSPDGKEMATARREGVIRRWEAGTDKEIDPPTGHVGPVDALYFTPDGRTLFSRGSPWWGTVVEWDVVGSKARRALFTKRGKVPAAAEWTTAALSPDGKIIALYDWGKIEPGTVRLIDARSGSALRALAFDKGSGRRVAECAFSPDGRLLATRDIHGIRLWSVA
jgi:RNA polymerase sigma factor (sigma-70 family)